MARQRFLPARGVRGTAGYEYYELSLALGPQQIGATGDNAYGTLFGRAWLMLVDLATNTLQMHQQNAVGVWTRVTVGLPPLFNAPIPAGAKRFTFAFDQSARAIVVYENSVGQVLVTRWTGSAYVQNVTFAGHDPTILMDATLADPRGYPNLVDDGWSVREAYFAGIPVFYSWIPDSSVRDNPVTDSDVVVFYLSTDRTQVYARTQRQLYGTPLLIHTFLVPVVLDRVVALARRYQLLVSDAAGDPSPEMLVSAEYLDNFVISPRLSERVVADAAPENIAVQADMLLYLDADPVDAAATPEGISVVGATFPYAESNPVDAAATPEGAVVVVSTENAEDANALDANATPEGIRVKATV